jgi:hypothetical protein
MLLRVSEMYWIVVVVFAAVALACGGAPPAPTPIVGAPPAASVTLQSARPSPSLYHVSGVVDDENGSPIPQARVLINYLGDGAFSSPAARCSFGVCWLSASADSAGHYEASFEPSSGPVFGADAAALIESSHDGYATNVQLLPRQPTEVVRDIRLRRRRTIAAGESVTVSIEQDSSLCSDQEDWFVLTSRCEKVVVEVATSGTLTVEARLPVGGASDALVFFPTSGFYTGSQSSRSGAASVGVAAGTRYLVYVGTPIGREPLRFEVLTSVR